MPSTPLWLPRRPASTLRTGRWEGSLPWGSADKLEWLALAGGFGASLDVEKALAVGLLPPMEQDRLRPVGNSSITGVALALTDEDVWAKSASVARMMTTLELSTDAGYMDRYTAALFIPHTDVSRFDQTEAEPAP